MDKCLDISHVAVNLALHTTKGHDGQEQADYMVYVAWSIDIGVVNEEFSLKVLGLLKRLKRRSCYVVATRACGGP